jgi:UrcA family protein
MNVSTQKVSSGRLTRVALGMFAAVCVGASAMSFGAEDKFADVPSVVVNYSDLNLATDHGAQMLYARITTAARHVCPEDKNLTDRVAGMARHCVSAAVARAVAAVDSPRLAAIDSERGRRPKNG